MYLFPNSNRLAPQAPISVGVRGRLGIAPCGEAEWKACGAQRLRKAEGIPDGDRKGVQGRAPC